MHSLLQAPSGEHTVAWLAGTALIRRRRLAHVTPRARMLVTNPVRALFPATLINVVVTSTRASLAMRDVSVGVFGDCVSHAALMSWSARRAGNALRCVVR